MSSCISTPTSLDAGNLSQSTPANGTSLVVDRDLGNWDDELAAEGPHVRHLLNDLVLQIPGKDEEVVRLCLAHHAGVDDWEMRPRKEEALLVRAAVDHVVEEVTAYPAVVEQRVPLRRRSVADDRLPVALSADEEVEQSPLHLPRALVERFIDIQSLEPCGLLPHAEIVDGCFD